MSLFSLNIGMKSLCIHYLSVISFWISITAVVGGAAATVPDAMSLLIIPGITIDMIITNVDLLLFEHHQMLMFSVSAQMFSVSAQTGVR